MIISPVITVALVIGLAHLDASTSAFKAETTVDMVREYGSDTLVVFLPGILADGKSASEPILDTLSAYGSVAVVSYGFKRFDPQQAVETIAQFVEDSNYRKYVLVGCSMGGLLAVDVLHRLHDMGKSGKVNSTRLVIVDAPDGGAQDMLGGGNIIAPILRFVPVGRAINALARPVMGKMLVPPKDENIESGIDAVELKERAIRDMSRFSLSIWRDQLVYMAQHAKLVDARIPGRGTVIYMMNTLNNETIRQPQSSDGWQRGTLARVKIMDVESPHCGFGERPATWNAAFREAFALLL